MTVITAREQRKQSHNNKIFIPKQDFMLTLRNLHLSNRLPAIHSHKPRVALLPAAQVQDQLRPITIQRSKNRLQPFKRELALREEERCDNNLQLQH